VFVVWFGVAFNLFFNTVFKSVDAVASCDTFAINGADVAAVVNGKAASLINDQVSEDALIYWSDAIVNDAKIVEGIVNGSVFCHGVWRGWCLKC